MAPLGGPQQPPISFPSSEEDLPSPAETIFYTPFSDKNAFRTVFHLFFRSEIYVEVMRG